MTAVLERIISVGDDDCPVCKTPRVTKIDAIGRTRARCPKCDGVSPVRRRHPDELSHSQVLVPASRAVTALPPVRPGQLRCQHCAKGLESASGRFCGAACLKAVHDARKVKPCRGCQRPYLPSNHLPTHCAECLAKEKAPKTRLCTGCNRIAPRTVGPKVVASCCDCRKDRRVGRVCKWKPKVCPCGATFDPPGPAAKYCEDCRPVKAAEWKANYRRQHA